MKNIFIGFKDRQNLQGLEVVEITPVILGGSATDPKNKMSLTRQQHIQYVRYWNSIISKLK